MDQKSKQNILRQLAKKGDKTAMQAIEKEMDKWSLILGSSSNYDELSNSLELLDAVAYRVPFKAVTAIKEFLKRESTLNLKYEEVAGYPTKERAKYHNKATLLVQVFKVLEEIRYHDPERIIDILLKYSIHENEEVAKQALESLTQYAKYHLDIFYGDGKTWGGLGPQPQEKLIEKLSSFSVDDKKKYASIIRELCREVLSPSIRGTSSTYKTVTLRTGSISATNEVKAVRKGAFKILHDLYPLEETPKYKEATINAMREVTRTPSQSAYGDELFSMVLDDTIEFLKFVKTILNKERNLQVVQSIEHDTYYMFRRGTTKKDVFAKQEEQIQALALEIKQQIDQNKEYQIFKILIGFEGIFSDWKTKEEDTDTRDFENERKLRNEKSREFAESVTKKDFEVWRGRILEYAKIDSNDLAMFPYFGKFLEHLAKVHPSLALELLSKDIEKLERFLVAILMGLWQSDQKPEAERLAKKWIKEGLYLYSLARFTGFLENFDKEILKAVFEAAKASDDVGTMTQVISSVSAQYKGSDKQLIKELFIPAIQELTKHNNPNWVHDFWFRNERKQIFENMDAVERKIVLQNLLLAKKITYQHEEVLAEIAKYSPEEIIEFFSTRIQNEKKDDRKNDEDYDYNKRYEAVPYSFSASLVEPLSKIPQRALDIVFNQYDGNYGMFMFRGGKLLSNIFVSISQGFSQKLIDLVRLNTEKSTMFVLGILRNYDGDIGIQEVCKELIKILPEDSELVNETMIALESTGVVSGEYGLAKAYEEKIVEIQPWLNDENQRIKDFAKKYIGILEKQIEAERKRSDERIALMKHEYGDDQRTEKD